MYEEIKEHFKKNSIPSFRFKQLEKAILNQYVSSFDDITTFPKSLRDKLSKKFELNEMFLLQSHKSGNTIKFLLKMKDGQFVESVLMNHNDGRRTVCLSCQIFCSVGCKFCATGANEFSRSLSTREIIEQALFVARYLKKKGERITNVVFMGMGEPFLNYDNIISSIMILNNPNFFNIGARHITVSTSGIVPKIYEYANFNLQTRLAISLHAADDKLRSSLMPINQRYPLAELMKACDYYVEKTNKRVSYEYVLIKGINDSLKCAKDLINLLKNRLAHVNLLVYNPHEFAKFEKPDKKTVSQFKDMLKSAGIEVSIRKSMGDDISGACGQLSGKEIKNS